MIYRPELVTDSEEIRELYEFIKKFPLDYPDYLEWVEKCFRELQLGYKKGVVCRENDRIIANIVFQRHKGDSSSLEMKNGRVELSFRRQQVFRRVYGAVERYARENGFKRIMCDTHVDSDDVVQTLEKLGFRVEAKETLYSKRLESILVKDLK